MSDYLELANDPDCNRVTLQRLLKQQAEDSGFTMTAYRGHLDVGITRLHDTGSIFTALDRDRAEAYTRRQFTSGEVLELYVSPGRHLDMGDITSAYNSNQVVREIVDSAYQDELEGWDQRETGEPWTPAEALACIDAGAAWDIEGDATMRFWKTLVHYIQNNDFDSVSIMDGGDTHPGISLVVFDPCRLKLAEPVVYDDKGEIVPLESRFDLSSPDIRGAINGPEINM